LVKKQKVIEQQVDRAELFDCAKEHELSHLQQQANQAQLIQHTIGNEVDHLLQQANEVQLMQFVMASEESHLHSFVDATINDNAISQEINDQYESNRLAESQRLEHSQNIFSLPNHHLSLEEAFKFLNAKDPKEHKWSDFEKSPIKSLLLWYANAGCFAFDEYKEYSMAFNSQQIDVKGLEKEIYNEASSDQELGNLSRSSL